MTIRSRLSALALAVLPPYNPLLHRFFQRYIDRYHGQNNDNIHTNGELALLMEKIPSCKVVFDVGANIGEWSTLCLQINPQLTIHCFEPSAATFQRLQANARSGMICNPFGLGSRPEERELLIFEDGSGINSLYRREGLEVGWGIQPQQKSETIRLDTLDHYCDQHQIEAIDFLKIDVEGHELAVLHGAEHTLSERRVRLVQFEYGGNYIDSRILLKDMFDFFMPRGYRLYKIFPSELRPAERYDQRMENFTYQNWAAIRAE